MILQFEKYQGTGNDFIMVEDANGSVESKINEHFITKLCQRRFGIGADGLILLQKVKEYDFKMVYFNSDGKQSTMCGNGGRCAAHFAQSLGWIKESTKFLAIDGPHEAIIHNDRVRLGMKDVPEINSHNQYLVLNTGSPHLITWTKAIDDCKVKVEGAEIRNSKKFKADGINVNFVQLEHEHCIRVRTYERGVEDETLSCGTGVTAAAIAAHHQGLVKSPVTVQTLGGDLLVEFILNSSGYEKIFLSGPVAKVYSGKFVN